MKNLAAKIKMTRTQRHLEQTLFKIHTYQLNKKPLPQTLIKTALNNISEILDANRKLKAHIYIENDEADMIITPEQTLTLAQLEQILTNKLTNQDTCQ